MLDYLLSLVKYVAISILNFIISSIAAIISTIAQILPDSPFLNTDVGFLSGVPYINYIGWIIPISSIISTIGLFVGAMLGYYILKIILKWIKMV